MDLDILYKNAKYFKERILTKTFVLKTKSGHIVIKPIKSDFSHLVGVQHSFNDEVRLLKANNFFEKAMKKEIIINDLTLNIDENHLTKKQTYILNKNLSIKKGVYGKNSIQLYKNNHLIEPHFEKDFNEYKVDRIVKYINTKYK